MTENPECLQKSRRTYYQTLQDNFTWMIAGFCLILITDSYPNGITFHQIITKVLELAVIMGWTPIIVNRYYRWRTNQ